MHYISINTDLSDLVSKIKWAQQNDSQAKAIANQGRKFAQENMMPENVLKYCYKVIVRYASLQRFQPAAPDFFEKMTFTLVSSPLTEEERAQRREMLKNRTVGR